MFSFLKNWLSKDQGNLRPLEELKQELTEETVVPASGESEDVPAAESKTADNKVRTELSLHPAWEEQLDAEKKYTLRFLQAELPEMVKGTIGVTGFSLIPGEEGVMVAMFFRNGTERPARFGKLRLSLLVGDKVFARHVFDLSDLDAIPPFSSRPWEVYFPRESFLLDNLMFDRWKVAIDKGRRIRVWPKHLDLDPEMEKRMTEFQKDRLLDIVDRLPAMSPDQVEITGFDIGRKEDGRLVVGLLFRNAQRVPYTPKQLRIKIFDSQRDVVASGVIDTSNVRVRPGTSRPWLVVFPASLVKKPDADLREWNLDISE